jgi:hypothetical protein
MSETQDAAIGSGLLKNKIVSGVLLPLRASAAKSRNPRAASGWTSFIRKDETVVSNFISTLAARASVALRNSPNLKSGHGLIYPHAGDSVLRAIELALQALLPTLEPLGNRREFWHFGTRLDVPPTLLARADEVIE